MLIFFFLFTINRLVIFCKIDFFQNPTWGSFPSLANGWKPKASSFTARNDSEKQQILTFKKLVLPTGWKMFLPFRPQLLVQLRAPQTRDGSLYTAPESLTSPLNSCLRATDSCDSWGFAHFTYFLSLFIIGLMATAAILLKFRDIVAYFLWVYLSSLVWNKLFRSSSFPQFASHLKQSCCRSWLWHEPCARWSSEQNLYLKEQSNKKHLLLYRKWTLTPTQPKITSTLKVQRWRSKVKVTAGSFSKLFPKDSLG